MRRAGEEGEERRKGCSCVRREALKELRGGCLDRQAREVKEKTLSSVSFSSK